MFFNRLDGKSEIKSTSQNIWNFIFFHRTTLSRKMTQFKEITKSIFNPQVLAKKNTTENIKIQPCPSNRNTSAREIACKRAGRFFNELILCGVILRKKNLLRWALILLLSRMLNLGRYWFGSLKFDDLPDEENHTLIIKCKNSKDSMIDDRKIELTESIASKLIFLKKIIFQLVIEENTNTKRVSAMKVLREKGILKQRQIINHASEFVYEDAFRYGRPFKPSQAFADDVYVYSGYRQHPNKLFDALYEDKVMKFKFAWHSFYNPQTTASIAKHGQEDELKFVNLAKEEMQAYLTERSVARIRKAVVNYGPEMDYFDFGLFCIHEPLRDFREQLQAKYFEVKRKKMQNEKDDIYHKSWVLMKTLGEGESKSTVKDRKNCFTPDKKETDIRQVDKHDNVYDDSDVYEEIKTPEAMKKVFATAKKMNLRSRNIYIKRQDGQSDSSGSISEDISSINDDAFTNYNKEDSDAELEGGTRQENI